MSELVRGEEAIIQEFLAPLSRGFPGAFGLTDDCALFRPAPGVELVLKTDPVAAGIHFFADDAAADIGWKALAVNVSDLAAKGATPRAYLMALSFPEPPSRSWLAGFSAGLEEAQDAFGMHLIGGDTDRRPGPLSISITVIGEIVTGRMVRRGTARPGDRIYVSGAIGDASLGLRLRQAPEQAQAWQLDTAHSDDLLRRYLRPRPRLGLAAAVREYAAAAMDVSDGLIKDLDRMCRASGCAASIEARRVPVSVAAETALRADPSLLSGLLTGGDDYEILAAVAADRCAGFEAAAEAMGLAVTSIGQMTAGRGLTVSDRNGQPMVFSSRGWDHF